MTRAQLISRYGWRSVFPGGGPADPNPMPRFRLFRWWPIR